MTGSIRTIAAAIALCASAAALYSPAVEIPKASGKALGVTRGKAFDNGVVFINGKYIEPPYVVERWGVGIRINGTPAVSQVVDWTEFLKTQPGVKVTKTEKQFDPYATPSTYDSYDNSYGDDTSLDDLFDDEPKPKKDTKSRPAAKRKKPSASVSYSLDGEFVMNDAARALVSRIKTARSEIDATLRAGGFICFGDDYSRVSGDQRAAMQLLERLPEIMRRSESAASLSSSVRAASMVYLTDPVCRDLFKNRIDYRKLQDRHKKLKEDIELNKMLKGMPLF